MTKPLFASERGELPFVEPDIMTLQDGTKMAFPQRVDLCADLPLQRQLRTPRAWAVLPAVVHHVTCLRCGLRDRCECKYPALVSPEKGGPTWGETTIPRAPHAPDNSEINAQLYPPEEE